MDWILPAGIMSHVSRIRIAGIVAVSIIFFFFFYFIALILLVNLPEDFLLKHQGASDNQPAPGLIRRILGFFLVLLGGILSLPGVIGPGSLFVIMGLIFLGVLSPASFGKYLSSRPGLIDRINRLRGRFGKPPLTRPQNR